MVEGGEPTGCASGTDIDRGVVSQCWRKIYVRVWSPERDVVVLGNGGRAESACYQERCAAQGVPVLRRKGGGEAVVLHPHCIVVSMGLWVRQYFHNAHYFACINAALIEILASYHTAWADLRQRGISDIAWGERKIGGTSIFRSRNYLLYQASLLYRTQVGKISALLPHPPREPDYRGGRTHAQFLCGLADLAPDSSQDAVSAALREALPGAIAGSLATELIEPPAEQCEGLLQRAVVGEARRLN